MPGSNDGRHGKKALRLLSLFVVALAAASAIAKDPGVSPRVPPDISTFVTPEQLKALDARMKPYVEQARESFPAAKARFLAGLGKGQSLFVMARIYDECGRSELAYISVTRIEGGIVEGRVWSNLPHIIASYRFRDRYAFPEYQLVDWLITHPDGTEEGNLAGKFLKAPK
jgi:hypothetical protein